MEMHGLLRSFISDTFFASLAFPFQAQTRSVLLAKKKKKKKKKKKNNKCPQNPSELWFLYATRRLILF